MNDMMGGTYLAETIHRDRYRYSKQEDINKCRNKINGLRASGFSGFKFGVLDIVGKQSKT